MRKIMYAAAGLGLATSASAAKFKMQLTPSAQQTQRMQSGIAAVDDTTAGSSVRLIQAEGDLKKRGALQVLIMNQGDKPFNIGPENITSRLADGTQIAIITYEQLAHEERKRQTWAAIAAGLGAMGNSLSAANAGYYHGTANYSGSTYGSIGNTGFNSHSSGTVSVSGYNAGQAQLAQSVANAQNQATFARLAENNASNMEALKAYMRTTTVDPQQMFGGSVTFELPKSVHQTKGDMPASFVVTINGEQHKFDVLLKRR